MSDETTPNVPGQRAAAARKALRLQSLSTGPWLTDFADTVLLGCEELEAEELSDNDRHHEIADGAVPIYTRDLLKTFGEDVGLMRREPELAAPGACIEDVAKAVLYELATEIIRERIED